MKTVSELSERVSQVLNETRAAETEWLSTVPASAKARKAFEAKVTKLYFVLESEQSAVGRR